MAEDRAGQVERLARLLYEERVKGAGTSFRWVNQPESVHVFWRGPAAWLIERGVTVGQAPGEIAKEWYERGLANGAVIAAPPPPKVTEAMVEAAREVYHGPGAPPPHAEAILPTIRRMLAAALRAASSGEA